MSVKDSLIANSNVPNVALAFGYTLTSFATALDRVESITMKSKYSAIGLTGMDQESPTLTGRAGAKPRVIAFASDFLLALFNSSETSFGSNGGSPMTPIRNLPSTFSNNTVRPWYETVCAFSFSTLVAFS